MLCGCRTAHAVFACWVYMYMCACFAVRQVSAYSPFSDLEEKTILNIHNKVRRTANPPGANIYMLTWNTKYKDLAQKASNNCKFVHNYGGEYSGLGENILLGNNDDPENTVMAWWLERENYNITDRTCDTTNRKYPKYNTCGHYYQAARGLVKEVGCARSKCSNDYLIYCEYTRNGENPPYIIGPPCSACPSDAPFCYRRMCVTLAQRDTIGANKTTCEIICKNCGTKVSSTNSCSCTCPTGFSGVDCSTKANNAVLPTPCSACAAAGTPCVNGASEVSSNGVCKCQCAAGFSGNQCEKVDAELCNGVLIKFAGNDKDQSFYPVDYHQWPKLLETVKTKLVEGINTICNSANKYSQCCPDSGSWGGVKKDIVTTADLNTAKTYPIVLITGEIVGIVNFDVKKSNALCPKAASWKLSGSIILEAFEAVKSSFRVSLQLCCDDYYMALKSVSVNKCAAATTTSTAAPSGPTTPAPTSATPTSSTPTTSPTPTSSSSLSTSKIAENSSLAIKNVAISTLIETELIPQYMSVITSLCLEIILA